ncbi:MAG: MoaD/ThiS family protein [Zetaproteobacteria bacterium]|nr:MAG: MoaD/ThiS family protein [Zetaproteobacteria bacterium]
MTIAVVLYAGLARYRPAGAGDRAATLDMTEGATVQEAMRRLGIPDDLSCLAVVNGARVATARVLRDGETLSLFPPLAGGVGGVPCVWVSSRTI